MSTHQPTPLTGFQDLDRAIEEINNPQIAAGVDDAEANIMSLDELRRKLCQPQPVPQKSRWRLW